MPAAKVKTKTRQAEDAKLTVKLWYIHGVTSLDWGGALGCVAPGDIGLSAELPDEWP